MPSNVLGDYVMGYISHTKVLSSWMLGFWTYHGKWGEVLSNTLWSLHLLTSADVASAQHHLFAFLLLSIRPDLTMFWMILLCISFFPLSHDLSPLLVSMDVFNSSASELVKYVEFAKAQYSSTLTCLHGCCSLFNVVRIYQMMGTGDCLDVVGNTHIILFFSHKIGSTEVNQCTEVT